MSEILFEFCAKSGGRLDTILSENLSDFSRSNIAEAIKAGLVFVDNECAKKPAKSIKIGQSVRILKAKNYNGNSRIPENSRIPNDLFDKIRILYEDDDILVLDKPSGLVVHEATSLKGEATLVDFLKGSNRTLSTLGGEFRAGIVHRLDRMTSGAMVVAKSDFASANLSAQLKEKSAGRIYLALIDLALKENCVINRAIARCESNRLKKAVYPLSHAGAKEAKSAFCNIYLENAKANLIAAKLFTGRTHQIRVHLNSINRHILGDVLYGFKGSCDKMGRIFLHANLLELTHPRTAQRMIFRASLPDDFAQILQINKGILDEKLDQNFIISCFDDYDKWLCIE